MYVSRVGSSFPGAVSGQEILGGVEVGVKWSGCAVAPSAFQDKRWVRGGSSQKPALPSESPLLFSALSTSPYYSLDNR